MAVAIDLGMDQGATAHFVVIYERRTGGTDTNPTVTPHDISGCAARMQIRRKVNRPVLCEATSEDDEITVGMTDGRIEIIIPAEKTALVEYRRCVYDLELVYPGGEVSRVCEGAMIVDLNVTE